MSKRTWSSFAASWLNQAESFVLVLIVYTVAISLKSHTLVAEPFLVVGSIAAIRRMLVITATSTEIEMNPARFHNTLVELGLLAATVIALALATWILRKSRDATRAWGRARAQVRAALNPARRFVSCVQSISAATNPSPLSTLRITRSAPVPPCRN
jgi:hypothetical protein